MSQPKFKLLVCSVFTLMFFIFFLTVQPAYCQSDRGFDFKGVEKIINPEFLSKLKSPENKTGIIVLLKGYKSYVGAVRADDKAQMAAMQNEIRQRQDAVLGRMSTEDFTLKYKYGNLLGFAGTATLDGIRALAAMDEVEVIEEDKEMEAHLAQGIPLMHASNPRSLYDGTGISVAIVDTGIDYSHSMLGGGTFPNSKVIGGYDFGDSDSDPMDCQGHGTAVAGIVAGTQAAGPGDYIGGVAHNAKLYGLKIISGCTGSASSSSIAAAWDWAVTHKNDDPDNPILIINTSFGGGYYQSACDSSAPAEAAAATNAVNNGITLFVSSGNEGYCDAMAGPACVSNAVSVGAVYDANLGSGFGFCISPQSC
ncbi:MAG TPA: S8 family serine peptidase, partial [Thermodesulfovibrionia bacterium]|nr:S8 family serine peptidase [Thermodesulfovibrionia bacterium]